jgi:ABC-type amino acid transport substrate-binding protein
VPLSIDLEGYSSTEYITYNNVVGYHSDIFPGGINSLSDLHGRHVIAFAGASEIIDKLGEHKQYFSTYTEERNQKLHSQLFLARKVDAVIADREIFMEYNRRLRGDSGNKNVKIAGIFPATHYKMVFRRYNDCLAFSESATKERTSFDLNEQPSTSKSYCYYK